MEKEKADGRTSSCNLSVVYTDLSFNLEIH